jgi:hypothetical protein
MGTNLIQWKCLPAVGIIGAQCSGALLLSALGLLDGVPACTDTVTKPWAVEAGITVLERSFHAVGNIATAGGCLASQYLAGWAIIRAAGRQYAEEVLHYVAPVGQKDEYLARAMAVIGAFEGPMCPARVSLLQGLRERIGGAVWQMRSGVVQQPTQPIWSRNSPADAGEKKHLWCHPGDR